MKKIGFFPILVILLSWLPVTQAQIASLEDAIDTSSRQRMLTQRMVRNYIQLGMEVRPDLANKELPQSIELFDTALLDLKRYASDNEVVSNALADVEMLWQPIKAVLVVPSDRTRAEQLWRDTENLLIACNTVVELLEESSDAPENYLINITGLQRMLSQRLTAFHMMRAWGFADPRYTEGFEDSTAHFKFVLDELIEHENTSPQIKSKLEVVKKLFNRLEKGARAGSSNFILGMIANSSSKVLKHMSEIMQMYKQG